MGETTGFMKYGRELPTRRPIPVRVLDWQEVYEDFPPQKVRTQSAFPRATGRNLPVSFGKEGKEI